MKNSYLRVRNKWKNIDNQKEYKIYFNRIIVMTNNEWKQLTLCVREWPLLSYKYR